VQLSKLCPPLHHALVLACELRTRLGNATEIFTPELIKKCQEVIKTL
jgi:hypothetical protein